MIGSARSATNNVKSWPQFRDQRQIVGEQISTVTRLPADWSPLDTGWDRLFAEVRDARRAQRQC
jgi:hypothetical protein